MLALKRKEGQWVEIIHRSGDVLRVRVYDIQSLGPGIPGRANLAFDDTPRNFEIRRPERRCLTGVKPPVSEAEHGFEPAAAAALAEGVDAEPFDPFTFRLDDAEPNDALVQAAERYQAEVDSHADRVRQAGERALEDHAETFAALADDDLPDPGDQAVS